MAKEKKKASELNLDEKLQASLVPIEEQPYKIPDTWSWIYAPSIFRIEYGKGLSLKKLEESGFPVFGANGLVGYYSEYMYDDEQALMSCRGAYSGVMNKSAPKSYVTSNSLVISSENKDITADYICYLFSALDVSRLISGSAQPQVTVQSFEKFPIPLPPIKEQQRIVARIESLFLQLDEAKDKAQEAIDGFDSRRAAILAQAFSGSLTERWRKEKNKEYGSWHMMELDSVCRSIFDGDHMPPPKTESGIPFIFISNVNTGQLSLEQTNYVSQEYYDQLKETRKPQKGDVLYTLVGSYGIAALVDTEQSFCFQRHMALLKPQKVLSRYLWYALQDKKVYDAATAIATGTAQMTVPIKGLRKIKIPVPSVEEQMKITESLDSIFNLENKAKEEANKVIDNIRNIKQAVLSKAFRGELGTHDSSDESAEELLKRILSEAPVEEKKKSITRRTKAKVVMNKDMLETVKEAGRITPERLKEETGLGIDEFYEELKRLTESGQISEKKEGGDVYLEVKDANR